MIMKYKTDDILNFYYVKFFVCLFIAFILQYFGLISVVNPMFKVHLLNMFVVT